MRLPTFLRRSSLLRPWGDSSITSVRSRPQRALPPEGMCSPICHSAKPSIRYTSPSTATRQSVPSSPLCSANCSSVYERSAASPVLLAAVLLAAPPAFAGCSCQYTAPPIMARPKIRLANVATTMFLVMDQILNVLAYSSAVSRHTSRRSASKDSHTSLACSSPPFGHVLFAYLKACGVRICGHEGFAQHLGLHVAIVDENELSNRSAEALGQSLSVLAQHAHPADIFGLGPVGSATFCALRGGIIPQTDIAIGPEIILNLPAELKDLGVVVALLL